MKNYLQNNEYDTWNFPYLGFILDEDGVEHDFGAVLNYHDMHDMADLINLDDYRHSESLKQMMKELYPDIILETENSSNLFEITEEIARYNIITYLNLSGEEQIADGSLQIGSASTLRQRAALREYKDFFNTHIVFPIYYFYDHECHETLYQDIEEVVDGLYERKRFQR